MALIASPAVVRAGSLLDYLASHPEKPFTVSELSQHLRIPRATCDSLLLGLARWGLVRRNADLLYQLGPTCISLGDAARGVNPVLGAVGVHAGVLAQELSSVVAVTVRSGDDERVIDVFDFGPPIGVRPRIGHTIPMVPPFGASFVAWDDDASVQAWLGRAEPTLARHEVALYLEALAAVRLRGYSITVDTARQPDLAYAMEQLGGEPAAEDARRRRDDAIRAISRSEYLLGQLRPKEVLRLTQIAAPVFGSEGEVAASILLLGPAREVSALEADGRASQVLTAARRATEDAGGVTR